MATWRDELKKFDPRLPLEQASTIPSSWYHNCEIEQLERSNIFGNCWQAVGRADQVVNPGDFFTAELAGEPLVVVRGEDSVLRAFYNVCRHRAAPVMAEAQGHVSRLRCRYHGWTYDLAGKLRGTPEFEGVDNFCREDNALPQISVAAWGPVVWVNMTAAPMALLEFLSPLPERTSHQGLEKLRFAGRRQYDLACNWKVYVDNYLDGGYHVNTVHPGLAGVIDYSHYRTQIDRFTSVQVSPLKQSGDDIGKVRVGDTAFYWWIFPNFMMNIYRGVMDTNLVLPLTAGSCRVIFDFYFDDLIGTDRERFIRESINIGHQIQLEDIGICEEVQRGLASRSYDTGRFSVRREAAGHHFHRLLAQSLWQSNH